VRAAKQPIVKYGFESHPAAGPPPGDGTAEPRQLEAQKGA
jgi:hypothetical protein